MAQFRDKELEAYSHVMEPPDEAKDGFTARTAVCAFFIGLFMLPGVMYLNLVVGASLGPAGQWVTVILFMEVLRRSRAQIKGQELYVLFGIAGMMMTAPFFGLLYNQYLVQSKFLQSVGLAEQIPNWVAPAISSESYALRTFFHADWIAPIGLIVFTLFIGRVDQFGLGLAVYYITAKVERLPFPMAPVGAAGTVALTENPENPKGWKWPAFSTGSAIGVVWGALYMGVPILSELLTGSRFEIFPIPWLETTQETERILKAVPTGITLDLGIFMLGLVVPFWGVVGSLFGVLFTAVLNPILVDHHVLTSWTPGMDTVQTVFHNNIDFYFSFGLGISLSVAIIGLLQSAWSLLRARGKRSGPDPATLLPSNAPADDGDTAWVRLKRYKNGIFLGIAIYLFATTCYGVLILRLVPTFPVAFLLLYGLVYVPVLTYINGRMQGLVGRSVQIPFVREATLILSGIRSMAVWFAPLGGIMSTEEGNVVQFRQMELTGTRFRSIALSQLVALPVIILFSLLASQIIWSMGPVPSQSFPFAEKMWELNVQNQAILWSSTTGGDSLFRNAWNPDYLLTGLGAGLALATVLSFFSLPINLFYGLIAGLNASLPHSFIMMLAGALFARFCLWKRFGKENWLRMAPVVVAGFGCGFGLSGMIAFGLALIQKTITGLPW